MHLTFCPATPHRFRQSTRQFPAVRQLAPVSPICLAKRRDSGFASTPSPKSRRAKRPRSNSSSGFSQTSADDTTAPEAEPAADEAVAASGPDLQKRDAGGISLEDRLREEIAHPLRKPKLTLFGTLAFSAMLGLLFALARLARADDAPTQVAQNVVVDIAAIGLFGYLAWREIQFGRRSLNSLAGQPEARDLQVMVLNEGAVQAVPIVGGGSGRRLGTLFKGKDVVVVAGRAVDVQKYLGRVAGEGGERVAVVALATDARGEEENAFEGAVAVASGEADNTRDWSAWIGDAVPPRKNVALFRIDAGDDGRKAANAYIVAVGEPMTMPLPANARRISSNV